MESKRPVKVIYKKLQERLDKNPTGAPPSEAFFEILEILFGEEGARVASLMPMAPAPIETIVARTKLPENVLLPILERLASRGIIFDMPNPKNGKTYYYLLPPVVGFFEFSMMRERDDIPQKRLAELIESVEDNGMAFVNSVFTGNVQVGRSLVDEKAIRDDVLSNVLDSERASRIIDSSKRFAVALCFCRHTARLNDHACGKPEEICLTLGGGAEYLIRKGIARESSKEECLDLLEIGRENGLVQIADNVRQHTGFICNCCGCCCGQLRAINNKGLSFAVHTSNFIAQIGDGCIGCGKCVKRCPIKAIRLDTIESNVEDGKPKKIARVDERICLGCGVCTRACNLKTIEMRNRPSRVLTPETTLERILDQAIERNKLQYILFDNVDGPTGDFLKTFVGAFLKMPALKRVLLNKEIKSMFLDFANRIS